MFNEWKLKDFAPGEGLALGVLTGAISQDGWIDVAVPGDVHTALIAAGRIPDPFYADNELACRWVEEREWWYRTSFTTPDSLQDDERLLLVFYGLDTYATIYLDGQEIGRSENMFHEVVLDITAATQEHRRQAESDCLLAVCFYPPLKMVEGRPAPFLTPPIGEPVAKNLMRKAQFGYGWDWGPRLPTVGIWRPVELRRQRAAAIESLHFVTEELADDAAHVSVKVMISPVPLHNSAQVETQNIALLLSIRLVDAEEREVASARYGISTGRITNPAYEFRIENPHPWWTHDLGEPYLYHLEAILTRDGEELDRKEMQVGIRTIELDQSPDPDEPETRFFRFVLNGVPIFAKGANWIPADSFVGAIPDERYARWIVAAREANMNMLRIWGGGIYEHDAFYDQCDRQGVMVWQDFMFACDAYPQDDPQFVDEVRQEAIYQVMRMRSHPCLAIWVGNNECQVIDAIMKKVTGSTAPLPGELFYDALLPEIVQKYDGRTPYWPGSPYGGRYPNDQGVGDVHDWTVWHGMEEDSNFIELFIKGPTPEQVAYTRYAEDMGRFISEFGMHASPVFETLRRVIPEEQQYHHSPLMDHHNKDNPKNKGDLLMMTSTGLPKDLAEYIDFSMIAQAEGLKFGIEHFRRRKPHCSGTLIWQLNDCWPVLSWAIMDYYGFGKAGYYYTRRVYAPLLASFKALENGDVELWISNDTLQPYSGSVVIQHGSFGGDLTWEETIQAEMRANSSQAVWRGKASRFSARPDCYLSVRSAGGAFPANRYFFVAIKDLQRPVVEPGVSVKIVNPHELRVQVEAPGYVFYFHITHPDESTKYSDNYFDLLPGEKVEIVVTNPAVPLKPGMLSFAWR